MKRTVTQKDHTLRRGPFVLCDKSLVGDDCLCRELRADRVAQCGRAVADSGHNCDAQAGASGGALLDRSHKNVIAVHGGTFFVRSQTVNGSSNALNVAPAGSRANPESWINHARKVDQPMINQLRYFVAYLAKDSSGQTRSLGQIPEY